MTDLRRLASTLLIGGACITGLTACGGATKISDSAFISDCKDGLSKNATLKAYSPEICKCAQDKLKARGLGDKTADDNSAQTEADKEIRACAQQKVSGQ